MNKDKGIPKVIHYCWFGGNPLPPLAEKCIASWKKFLPDYEIKRWDESNFDVNMIPYTKEAYEAKKYAFVSDFARFWILYNYGGVYFDTDVEVIKPFDDILAQGPFMGCENNVIEGQDPSKLNVAPGLGLAVEAKNNTYKELIDLYKTLHFKNPDGSNNLTTIVDYTTGYFCNRGLRNTNEIQNIEGINIYPREYFCPRDSETHKLKITDKTHSIHHYQASWVTGYPKFKKKVAKLFGKNLTYLIVKTKRIIFGRKE